MECSASYFAIFLVKSTKSSHSTETQSRRVWHHHAPHHHVAHTHICLGNLNVVEMFHMFIPTLKGIMHQTRYVCQEVFLI